MTLSFTEVDTPPAGFEIKDHVSDEPIDSDSGQPCEDCGTFVARSPKGRQFNKCLDCRRAARGVGTAQASGSSPTGRRSNWEAPLAAQLTEMIQGIGMAVSFVESFDGNVIMAGSERLGQALIAPARTNPKVRKALESAVNGGAWGQVVMACAAIAIPIAMHHGLIPTPKPKQPPYDQPVKANEGHISV